MAKLRPIKVLKELLAKELSDYHDKARVLEDELKKAKLHKQKHCPHPEDKIKIVDQSYMEEGKMRSPIEWKEKVCRRCGMVVATSHTTEKMTWQSNVKKVKAK